MKKANLPTERAQEPEEEAQQPLNVPPVQNKKKEMNINFADGEKPDSQSSSIYTEALSQPAEGMSRRQTLQWFQKRRAPGLWAQCKDCNRWRYLSDVLDKHELPRDWYCKMNPDSLMASCSAPEVPIRIHDEEDLIYSEFNAGSLVVGRMDGWPWWPAMVDDCPDTQQYYWLDGFSDIPTHYHVVFFDESEVTRAWLAPSQLKPYSVGKKILKSSLKIKSIKSRLELAISQADDAKSLTQTERLSKYSFITRYNGDIVTPKKINKKSVEKYQKQFKRKFSVALPDKLFESDSEGDGSQSITDTPKSNVIMLGTKRNRVDEDGEVEADLNQISTIIDSMAVEVDTNSDMVKTNISNDTSATYAPDSTVQVNTAEESRGQSATSNEFDF